MNNNEHNQHQVIAKLSPEEVQEFKAVYEEELALKHIVDAMMDSAREMGKKLIARRKGFWDKMLSEHNLMPDEKYAIDIRTESLISVTEDLDIEQLG